MRFETIIIGGGLSALTLGISLQKVGKRCLIVSEGQSALHFFSGSFSLVETDGLFVDAIKNLPAEHPYTKIGAEKVLELAATIPGMFSELGYTLSGNLDRNHKRTTALGESVNCWLTVEGDQDDHVVEFPMSWKGVMLQKNLRTHFEQLGGTFFNGDSVVSGEFSDGSLLGVRTRNHGTELFSADSYVLASGSFFSCGLVAERDCVREPVFGFDVDWSGSRDEWFSRDVFGSQPYMRFGVSTDSSFNVKKDGNVVGNVYAVGSVLSGTDSIKEGCGGGVAMVTALFVAELIKQRGANNE